jgi:hypothetical protein
MEVSRFALAGHGTVKRHDVKLIRTELDRVRTAGSCRLQDSAQDVQDRP